MTFFILLSSFPDVSFFSLDVETSGASFFCCSGACRACRGQRGEKVRGRLAGASQLVEAATGRGFELEEAGTDRGFEEGQSRVQIKSRGEGLQWSFGLI